MKAWLFIASATLCVSFSSCERQADKPDLSDQSAESDQSEKSDPPTTINTEATAVFKRAFWKRPSADDKILHAERREWADADGVDRWQWFIAVEPSETLRHYLIDENPFSLAEPSGKVAMPGQSRPEWFPAKVDGHTVRQSQDGQMLFLIQKEKGTLFATSQGYGFSKAIEVTPTAPQPQGANPPGRLPTTPPPAPADSKMME